MEVHTQSLLKKLIWISVKVFTVDVLLLVSFVWKCFESNWIQHLRTYGCSILWCILGCKWTPVQPKLLLPSLLLQSCRYTLCCRSCECNRDGRRVRSDSNWSPLLTLFYDLVSPHCHFILTINVLQSSLVLQHSTCQVLKLLLHSVTLNWPFLSLIKPIHQFTPYIIYISSSTASGNSTIFKLYIWLLHLFVRHHFVSPHRSRLWSFYVHVDVVLVPAIILHAARTNGVHVESSSSPQRFISCL